MIYHLRGPIDHVVPTSMGQREDWNVPLDADPAGRVCHVAGAADRVHWSFA